MKRHPKLIATLVFFAATMLTFIAGMVTVGVVGNITHSGLVGICGAYGQYVWLLVCIFLASFPASLGAGIFSAWQCYRILSKPA